MSAVKTEVNKVLEPYRKDKAIGSSLQAEVVLYCDTPLSERLGLLEDELRFLLMVSKAEVQPIESATETGRETETPGLKIAVSISAHPRCERCWHLREDVGQNSQYPDLCPRCVTNISTGPGEERFYA